MTDDLSDIRQRFQHLKGRPDSDIGRLLAALHERDADIVALKQQLASMSSATTQEQKELLDEIAGLRIALADRNAVVMQRGEAIDELARQRDEALGVVVVLRARVAELEAEDGVDEHLVDEAEHMRYRASC